MKIFKNISILMILVFILSCTGDNGNGSDHKTQSFTIKDSGELLRQMKADKNYKVLNGKFLVWQTEDNEIVMVNPAMSERNMFILQGANKKTNFTDGYYQVLYLKHSLLIQNKGTGENLYLKVPKKEEKTITSALKKNIEIQNEIEGYGLVFGTMDIEQNNLSAIDYIKKQPSIVEYLNATATTDNAGDDCWDGGEGSSSCANSHCSVSCQSGYYACCTLHCNCKPNPDPQPYE